MRLQVPQLTTTLAVQRLVSRFRSEVPLLARLDDVPAFQVALCCRAQEMRAPQRWRYIQQRAIWPHQELSAELDLPRTRLLRRLTSDALTPRNLDYLRVLQLDPSSMRILRHASLISEALLVALIANYRSDNASFSTQFFTELGNLPTHRRPQSRSISLMLSFLTEFDGARSIQSVQQLRRLWDKWGDLADRYEDCRRVEPHFPTPPVPEEDGYIEALRTWRDLIDESLFMRNCTGADRSLIDSILLGRGYFYRVHSKWGMARATLYVVRGDDDTWCIEEARKRFNKPVAGQQLRSLAIWLADRQRLENESLCLPSCEM